MDSMVRWMYTEREGYNIWVHSVKWFKTLRTFTYTHKRAKKVYLMLFFLTNRKNVSFFLVVSRFCPGPQNTNRLLIQDAKNNVDADLVMLEELKVKCRTQTEQIMAWKKAYSMQVIFYVFNWV